MLVIRRRPGETLLIGDQVEVEILEATASHVKLGIRAPKSIAVMRKEIQVTREQNLESAREAEPDTIKELADSLKKGERVPIRRV